MTDQPAIQRGQTVLYAQAPYTVLWAQGGLLGLRGKAYESGYGAGRAREACVVLEGDVKVDEDEQA